MVMSNTFKQTNCASLLYLGEGVPFTENQALVLAVVYLGISRFKIPSC